MILKFYLKWLKEVRIRRYRVEGELAQLINKEVWLKAKIDRIENKLK